MSKKNPNQNIHNIKNEKLKYSSKLVITRLYTNYASDQKNKLILIAFCMLIVALTTALSAWLMQPALDDIFLHHKKETLFLVPFAIFLLSLIKAIASFYQNVLMKIIGYQISTDIQLDMYKHILKADIEFFNRYSSGHLLSYFTNDVNSLKNCISNMVSGVICELVTFIGLAAIMFYQSIVLSILVFFVFPIAIYPIISIGKRMRKVINKMQKELSKFTKRLDDIFSNIRLIKSYVREEYEITRGDALIKNIKGFYKKITHTESTSTPVMELVGGMAIASVIWYGGYEVIGGKSTPGAFFSFITALLMMYKPLKAISQLNNTLQEATVIANRLFNIMDEKPRILNLAKGKNLLITKYNIEFRNVSFAYNKQSNYILKNFSCKIPHHSTVAFVGFSGVGKSTIFHLMQRFYDLESGSIRIGGHNITNISLHQLRKSIAIVSQDVLLFNDTIMQNIGYGKLNASKDEIIEAAKISDAHDFIMSLPKQYNTVIGQRGIRLSGGQKQRITIARAILKDAPILLLDEATSALDSFSESQIQNALNSLKVGRTTIVIAHRLSTIENADMIHLLSKNGIIDSGTHQELIQKKGDYYDFYHRYKVLNNTQQ